VDAVGVREAGEGGGDEYLLSCRHTQRIFRSAMYMSSRRQNLRTSQLLVQEHLDDHGATTPKHVALVRLDRQPVGTECRRCTGLELAAREGLYLRKDGCEVGRDDIFYDGGKLEILSIRSLRFAPPIDEWQLTRVCDSIICKGKGGGGEGGEGHVEYRPRLLWCANNNRVWGTGLRV
jgi:hypothetical protein